MICGKRVQKVFRKIIRNQIEKADNPQSAFTFSKLTIETLEQGVTYVQS